MFHMSAAAHNKKSTLFPQLTSHVGLGLVTKVPAADQTHGTLDVVINEVHSNETRKITNVRVEWALSPARRA